MLKILIGIHIKMFCEYDESELVKFMYQILYD